MIAYTVRTSVYARYGVNSFLSSHISAAPGAPSIPTVSDVTRDSCMLSWQPPEKDGGSPITGYHVERRSNTSKRWVFINKEPLRTTRFLVKDLYVENEYTFRVSAENKGGCGPPSQVSEPVMAKDPWGGYTGLLPKLPLPSEHLAVRISAN